MIFFVWWRIHGSSRWEILDTRNSRIKVVLVEWSTGVPCCFLTALEHLYTFVPSGIVIRSDQLIFFSGGFQSTKQNPRLPPAIKHSLLDNGPFIREILLKTLHSVQGFSTAMFDETRGFDHQWWTLHVCFYVFFDEKTNHLRTSKNHNQVINSSCFFFGGGMMIHHSPSELQPRPSSRRMLESWCFSKPGSLLRHTRHAEVRVAQECAR